MFQKLLKRLDDVESVGMPDAAPGGTSITQIALSKGYDEILGLAIEKPNLFPR